MCEIIAQQLSPEAVKTLSKKGTSFPEKVIKVYVPALPSSGREGPTDLAKYCIVCGLLLRGVLLYVDANTKFEGIIGIAEKAIRRRDERLQGFKPNARAEVEKLVNREAGILRLLARKMDVNPSYVA